jgi:DNA polymerase/3'-5' exonuclease PolX
MSQTTTKRMDLARAQQLAEAVRGDLAPHCERIEVAGSVRRRAATIGDLEFVCIPKYRMDLLGNPLGSELDSRLDRLVLEDRFHRHKNGERQKQFTIRSAGCKLELYICDEATWAVVMTIRTGSAEFSHRFVTQKKKGGLLPDNMKIGDGTDRGTNRLYIDGTVISTPTEEDLFRLAQMKWIHPWERR